MSSLKKQLNLWLIKKAAIHIAHHQICKTKINCSRAHKTCEVFSEINILHWPIRLLGFFNNSDRET